MISKKEKVGVSKNHALTILLPLFIIIMADGKFNNLEAYTQKKTNANINISEKFISISDKITDELSIKSCYLDSKKGIVRYETYLTNKKVGVKEEFDGMFNTEVNAYELNISGKKFGYINSNQNTNRILKLVVDKYIENLHIQKQDVISADIILKMDLRESKVNISKIRTQEEISEEIYKNSVKNDQLLNIDIKIKETVEEVIPQGSIIVDDDTMYLGEVKEVVGQSGKKIVQKEVIYSNGEISNINTLKEDVINTPKDTVIHKGSKNPYDYGIAFLKRPTRGGFTTSNYGPRWESFHKGIDIAGNIGDDVMAAIDGVVTYAQYNDGGYGNLIMIKHEDSMVTYYAHLSVINVSVGEKVLKGDIIGLVGNTGFSTGPHLHFELRVNDQPVNPSEYLIG